MSAIRKGSLPGGSRKRAQILEELRRQIAEKGTDGLTMRDLANSSGVATRTLFNLFGSKDALIRTSLKELDQEFHKRITFDNDAEGSPLEQLMEYTRIASGSMKFEPGYARAVIETYYSTNNSHREFHEFLFDLKKNVFLGFLGRMRCPAELKLWVSRELLASRLVENHFSVMAEWVRGGIADDQLGNAAMFAMLSVLIGHVGIACEARVVSTLTSLIAGNELEAAESGAVLETISKS